MKLSYFLISCMLIISLSIVLFDAPQFNLLNVLAKVKTLDFENPIADAKKILGGYTSFTELKPNSFKAILNGVKNINSYLRDIFNMPIKILSDIIKDIYLGFKLVLYILGIW